MTPAEAIDLALPLLKRETRENPVDAPLYAAAWDALQVLRTAQAEAALVAKDPANQIRPETPVEPLAPGVWRRADGHIGVRW